MKEVTVTSDNRDELYQTTVFLFNNVRQMCLRNVAGWELEESFTDVYRQHFITKYTNGKMWIRAESVGDNHIYSYGSK